MQQNDMANLKQTDICRFCLHTEQEINLTPVLIGFFTQMLKELNLNMNLLVSKNPVICYNCLDKLQKSVFFKEMCNIANERKYNAKELPCINVNFCTLCPDMRSSCIKAEILENNLVQDMLLQRYVPWITYGQSRINICQACDQHLKVMDGFLKVCLNTEARISIFIKVKKCEGVINLQSVIDHNFVKEEVMGIIKEEIEIEVNDVKPNIRVLDGYRDVAVQHSGFNSRVPTGCSDVADQESNFDSSPTPASEIRQRKKTKNKSQQTSPERKERKKKPQNKSKIIRTYKTSNNNDVYCCNNCKFKSKFKASLVRHLIIHKNNNEVETFQCNECDFVTKYKASLVIHFLVHKKPSEIPMFQCDVCPFQSKLKKNLLNHKITHKNFSEHELIKCPSCPFKTKFKSNLAKHSIVHKSESEVTMYKCLHCPYETRFKRNLKKHSLTHKNPSEIPTYNCDKCDFVTKFKYSLIKHALVHKDASEVKMHKCGECSFQTKFKYGLIRHGLTHKSISEVSMLYECEHCSYKSKLKSNLVQHCSRHRLPKNDAKKKSKMGVGKNAAVSSGSEKSEK